MQRRAARTPAWFKPTWSSISQVAPRGSTAPAHAASSLPPLLAALTKRPHHRKSTESRSASVAGRLACGSWAGAAGPALVLSMPIMISYGWSRHREGSIALLARPVTGVKHGCDRQRDCIQRYHTVQGLLSDDRNVFAPLQGSHTRDTLHHAPNDESSSNIPASETMNHSRCEDDLIVYASQTWHHPGVAPGRPRVGRCKGG